MIILNARIHLKLLSAKLCSFYKIQSRERNGSCPFLAISLLSRFFALFLLIARLFSRGFIMPSSYTHMSSHTALSYRATAFALPSLCLPLCQRGSVKQAHMIVTPSPLPTPTHTYRLFIHFPPSQTHSQHTHRVHTFRLDTTKLHTPHTQLSEQLTPPAHSLSDSVTFFSHGDKTVLQSLCLHSALIFSLFLPCTHTCTRSILEEAYVKFLWRTAACTSCSCCCF